jgi:hypothetical protein
MNLPSLLSRFALDFGSEYKQPWHKCCRSNPISIALNRVLHARSAYSFNYCLLLLRLLNILFVIIDKLASNRGLSGSVSSCVIWVALMLTLMLGSRICWASVSINFELLRYWQNSIGNFKAKSAISRIDWMRFFHSTCLHY